MKKISLAIMLFLAMSNINAQNSKKIAQELGDHICNCFNKAYADFDDKTKESILKITKMSADEQSQYVNSMKEAERTKFIEKLLLFESKQTEVDACIAGLESKYADEEITDETDDKEFTNMMLERLKSKKKCAFAYGIMMLGDVNDKTEE